MAEGQAISVQSLAEKLLAAVEQHYAAAGAQHALPDRRGVIPGEPRGIAWDCEQLTVTLAGIGWGNAQDGSPSSPQAGNAASVISVRHAVYAVTLVRCTPVSGRNGQPPTMDALQAAGLLYMRDAGLLSQALVEFASKLRQQLPREARVQPGIVDPVGPLGGFHALETTLAVTAAKLE